MASFFFYRKVRNGVIVTELWNSPTSATTAPTVSSYTSRRLLMCRFIVVHSLETQSKGWRFEAQLGTNISLAIYCRLYVYVLVLVWYYNEFQTSTMGPHLISNLNPLATLTLIRLTKWSQEQSSREKISDHQLGEWGTATDYVYGLAMWLYWPLFGMRMVNGWLQNKMFK